ncbi:allophanate hydrolase subunit 1 [Mycolicibacterium madagascariense]|nr:allophanate hydrolase subunit 1 [Mycolicibacterium madagascariense]
MPIAAVHDYGDRALLLEFANTDAVLAWCDAVRAAALPAVVDVVPASRTVLVELTDPVRQAATRAHLERLRVPRGTVAAAGAHADVTIDVVYDGADLDDVARLTGLSAEQVVDAHTAAPLRVGFAGFAPGFAYLIGGDRRLHVPRRAEPRTRVPAGSVGLAGEFSGVYPRETPGGWQLIGHTDAVLWDVERDPPALLVPGTWVRFRAIG